MVNIVKTNPELINEMLIPVKKVGDSFPYPVGRKAVERFIRSGVRGVQLETVLIGSRRFSSKQAIERFVRETNRTKTEEVNQTTRMTAHELEQAKLNVGLK
ncbi:MAG: DUF1580 domain-containing protein [Thermoguttaceae bacterium]